MDRHGTDGGSDPASRLRLLREVTGDADEAPTVEEALRRALARICSQTGWEAGRLRFSAEAGSLAGRTLWHLESGEKLSAYRALAERNRDRVTPAGDGAVFACPIEVAGRPFAVLEFFSRDREPPAPATLEIITFACAELGRILQRKPADEALRRSERDYRALFENAGDGILIVDPASASIVDANARASVIYGATRAELVGLSLSRLWTDADTERARLDAVAAGRDVRAESTHRRLDGSRVDVDVTAGPVEYGGRHAIWLSTRDVGERIRVLDALRASEERYRLLFESSPQPMWVHEQDTGRFLAVNEAAVRRYGWSRDEFLRMTSAQLAVELPPDQAAARGSAIVRHRTAPGIQLDVELTAHDIDFEGRRARLVVANDVTERLRAEEKLWRAAFYDMLTGLPNRALFIERLGQAIARSKGRGATAFGVLFLDLDRFKLVNDSLGHRAGDRLLVQIARRLERIRRTGDTVARLGGDEFAILVEGLASTEECQAVADRVHRELSLPFDVGSEGTLHEVYSSCSIGIALGGPGVTQAEELLRDADTAMYRAKSEGSARHAVFDITMHDRAVASLQLEQDLRRAIDRREMRVQFQPVLDLRDGRIVGFEALARWQHRLRGEVQPKEFIPLAEEMGLIGPMDRFVLQAACEHLREFHHTAPGLHLSVNLSGRELLQADLVEQIEGILRQTGIAPRALRLEITETVLVENAAQVSTCLERLRALGVRLCIDDFGTGYSSLSYLHRLPIDVLKVDASFIRTMGVDEKNRKIVETILLLGRNLGVEVVAEGVETQAQADVLSSMGCDLAQGYLFSAPLEIPDALEYVRSRKVVPLVLATSA